MEEAFERRFARVIAETLESLAFVFAFDEGERRNPDGPCVELCFSGHFSGAFFLWLDHALLGEITENMLGIEEGMPVSTSQLEDALREAANVVCGNLLPEMGGREAVFDLIPSAVYASGGLDRASNGRKISCQVTLSVEDAVLTGALWLENPTAFDEQKGFDS